MTALLVYVTAGAVLVYASGGPVARALVAMSDMPGACCRTSAVQPLVVPRA